MRDVLRYGFILASICIIAGGLLATVHFLTRARIAAQVQAEEKAALLEVLPEGINFEPMKSGSDIVYYKAYGKENKFLGVAFKTSAKGYSSQIDTMVGMTRDGTITTIKILNQNETPGLGSKIVEISDDTTIWDVARGKKKTQQTMKPWFQERFKSKKIEDLKNIQAITGATVSSKAVIDSVEKKAKEIRELIENGK